MTNYSLAGTGSALPDYRETNDAFVERTGMDTSDEWIRKMSGIESRPLVRGPHLETDVYGSGDLLEQEFENPAAHLGSEAVRNALEMAEVEPGELDLLMVGTWTPDNATPGTQDLIAQELEIDVAGSDVSAACASFTYALANAAAMLESDMNDFDTVAVVGVDIMSDRVDWNDRGNSFLFSDGAGAVILKRDDSDGGVVKFDGGVLGRETFDYLYVPQGDTVQMKGPSVMKTAVPAATESILQSLRDSDVDVDELVHELGLFIPHQANRRITKSIQGKLGITDEHTVDVIDHTANSSSATIPLALDEAMREGRVGQDDILAMVGFGAGMTYGTVIMRTGNSPEIKK